MLEDKNEKYIFSLAYDCFLFEYKVFQLVTKKILVFLLHFLVSEVEKHIFIYRKSCVILRDYLNEYCLSLNSKSMVKHILNIQKKYNLSRCNQN